MRTVLLFLFLSGSLNAFSKGASGIYHMKGVAYAADKSILKNTELTVKFGEKITKLMTDENGNYDIEVRWATACPSGLTPGQRNRETNRLNPDFIFVQYGEKELKIKNDWEKYTFFKNEEREPVKKQDLLFV